jgi:fructose-1,6-bisphosphatase I
MKRPPPFRDAEPMRQTLRDFLRQNSVPEGLGDVLSRMADTCAGISRAVAAGAILDQLGSAGTGNVQQEEQKQLDVITNDMLLDTYSATPWVAGVASEEMETFVASSTPPNDGAFLVLFDPLDGSSNIDVNVSVGTIFSVLPSPATGRALTEADFLQPGRNQRAAGYVVYGPQTTMVLTVGNGVHGFTLDPASGAWLLTHSGMTIPRATKEFAINMSNMRHWAAPIRAYIEDCLAGETGPRGKNFNMRWIASMVADVHRILVRGGVFMYPADARDPSKPGKLRLMYEGNPMALLVEQAGGRATDVNGDILDIVPTGLHQRIAVVLGSAEEVERVSA